MTDKASKSETRSSSASNAGDGYISPGTKVRIPWIDEDGKANPEYGIIVHCWYDPDLGVHDCFFASFGDELPHGCPSEKPAILRYTTRSFEVVGDEEV